MSPWATLSTVIDDAQSPAGPGAIAGGDASTLAPGLALLPLNVRSDVYRLYDVLRVLDDAVDEDRGYAEERVAAVERWAEGENPDRPECWVLADLSRRYPLSSEAFVQLCLAMRQDISRDAIETEEDLERYCRRVGGSVAIMLAQILGTSDPEGEARMAMLGTAMQRTNILRDIDEDAAQGRVYIPRETIERFGPPTPGARDELMRDQVARVEAIYEEVRMAMPRLSQGQRGVELCAALYRAILRQIERDGYGRRPGRVVVPAWRRKLIIARYRVGIG